MHGPMRGPAQHPAQTLATTSAARPRAPPAAAASLPRRQGHQHGRVLLGSRMMRVCASGFVHTATMPPHHVSRLHEPVGSPARTEQASRACRRGRTPLTETAQPASVLNLNLLLGLQQHSTPHKPQHATARSLLPSSERRMPPPAPVAELRARGAGGSRAGSAPVLQSFHVKFAGRRGDAGPGPHRCWSPSTTSCPSPPSRSATSSCPGRRRAYAWPWPRPSARPSPSRTPSRSPSRTPSLPPAATISRSTVSCRARLCCACRLAGRS